MTFEQKAAVRREVESLEVQARLSHRLADLIDDFAIGAGGGFEAGVKALLAELGIICDGYTKHSPQKLTEPMLDQLYRAAGPEIRAAARARLIAKLHKKLGWTEEK